jgi:hypothetical protein
LDRANDFFANSTVARGHGAALAHFLSMTDEILALRFILYNWTFFRCSEPFVKYLVHLTEIHREIGSQKCMSGKLRENFNSSEAQDVPCQWNVQGIWRCWIEGLPDREDSIGSVIASNHPHAINDIAFCRPRE